MVTTEKTRIPLADAQSLANEVVELFRPVCTRIEIAGSIRRKKEFVGDIEIVCMPRMEPQYDMFGDICGQINDLYECEKRYLEKGILEPRLGIDNKSAFGERYQRLVYKGFALDMFCVLPPAQWGVIFTIRTGPHTFSKRIVTSRLLGGLLAPGNQVQGGQLLVHGKAVDVPEEGHFFSLNEIPWIEPEDRL